MADIIMAVDPGQTTGVCIIKEFDKAPNALTQIDGFQVMASWQIPWESRISFFVALFSGAFATDDGEILLPGIVVIESFRLRPGRAMEQIGSEFPSVRVIGIVETLIYQCTVAQPLLVFQEPAIIGRVEILPEHKQQLSGLIHAQDAYRHARYYHLTTHRRNP